MNGGFTFCGVDVANLGLEYAPELEDTYVYRPAKQNVYDQVFEGHNGGHFYGASYEPKEFILRCIFEETAIDKGFLSSVQSFFRVGKSGKLIFKRRPWCYYYATIVEYDDTGITNYLNGIIKITMKAYYPFARCDDVYSLRTMPYHENIIANTALYDIDGMAPQTDFEDITSKTDIIIGNPGSVDADVAIRVAGNSGGGVIIRNNTNKTEVKIVAMSKAKTTNVNKEVRIDGISGKTTLYDNDTGDSKIAFLYHGYGFLKLDPGYPVKRNIYISYVDGSSINASNIIHDDYIGMYIYADSKWHKIIDQPDNHTFIIDGIIENPGSIKTTIMKMNEITIEPVDSMDLSKLSFVFKPTFA